jgi:hypothetical protein
MTATSSTLGFCAKIRHDTLGIFSFDERYGMGIETLMG